MIGAFRAGHWAGEAGLQGGGEGKGFAKGFVRERDVSGAVVGGVWKFLLLIILQAPGKRYSTVCFPFEAMVHFDVEK